MFCHHKIVSNGITLIFAVGCLIFGLVLSGTKWDARAQLHSGYCDDYCEEGSSTSLDSGSPSVSQATHTIVTGLVSQPSVVLTVDLEGLGSGEITSDVPGITCTTGMCAASFAHGTIVTLTATAEADSAFVRFSGDTDCTDGVVTLDTHTTCHATFRMGAEDNY